MVRSKKPIAFTRNFIALANVDGIWLDLVSHTRPSVMNTQFLIYGIVDSWTHGKTETRSFR